MKPHSAAWCQCNSRMPPALRRMFTPEMEVETWKSSWVTCRAQPPSWMRRGALLNEAQNSGRPPTSVAGGVKAARNCPDSAGFCGPGSTALRGLPCVFTMPWGGSSGLPKLAALARVAKAPTPAAAPAAAPAARILRRDTDIFGSPIVARRTERMIGLATRSRTESGSPPLQRKADFEANDPQQGDRETGSPTPMRSAHFEMPAPRSELGDGAK